MILRWMPLPILVDVQGEDHAGRGAGQVGGGDQYVVIAAGGEGRGMAVEGAADHAGAGVDTQAAGQVAGTEA